MVKEKQLRQAVKELEEAKEKGAAGERKIKALKYENEKLALEISEMKVQILTSSMAQKPLADTQNALELE